MARAIELIERDIAALSEAASFIAQKLQGAYGSYLNTLGQAVQRQLVLAVYHLCTQGYPEKFLNLSLNQRQQLQQEIRLAAQKNVEQLLALLNPEKEVEEKKDEDSEDGEDEERDEEDLLAFFSSKEDLESEDEEDEEDSEEYEEDGEDEEDEEDSEEYEEYEEVDEEELKSLREIAEKLSKSPGIRIIRPPLSSTPELPVTLDPSNPVILLKWQHQLEMGIQKNLRKLSREANVICQKAGMLPQKIPQRVLDAAASMSAESPNDIMPGPPNLLSLVVEIDQERPEDSTRLTQIVAIGLRLGEIEFADTAASASRNQIRAILAQLHKLAREYQKKQRELSVAQAESAWRASWFE